MTKLEQFRSLLKENDISGALIYDPINQYYLTGFHFEDGLVMISQHEAILLTDFRYYVAASREAYNYFRVITLADFPNIIDRFFEENKVVGFEGDYLAYSKYSSLCEKYPKNVLKSFGNIIDVMRLVKSEDEIEKMKRAQFITDQTFSHMLDVITLGMTELDVAVEIDYTMRKLGAESNAFNTIAVSGDASAIPHGTPRNEKLKAGFLTMDFGAKFKGYCADMTRTVVIGKADAEIKKLYNTVLAAQNSALAFLREGVSAFEADKVARDIIDAEREYKGAFGHSLGHSIGMRVHEMPGLSPKSKGVFLKAGQVTSVEPGIYLAGKYGCRIEDMVQIKENGIYNFTRSTKELIEIY